MLYVAISRVTELSALAFDPVLVKGDGEIVHLPFYEVKRFTSVNTSKRSLEIMQHLRWLQQRAREFLDAAQR